MRQHEVRVHKSKDNLPRDEQLAWKIAAVAADKVAVERDVAAMIVNRMIDNAAVAIAAINRRPVVSARDTALGHSRRDGAGVFGVPPARRVSPEWAAWANGTAVRELDMHDTFLAADYSHPGDNIPPILAVAQTTERSGRDLIRGIATGYEIQIDLVRAICLHAHKIDHIAHLCPAQAAGIGTLLRLPTETIYQAVQQAVHVSFTTRQSRKGEISSWKAYAPAHAGKLAVEAVDRCMRGEGAPSPIYEGEDSVIAWMLDGPNAHLRCAAARARRAEARYPGQLHQGAQRRIPVAGADRSGVPHAREIPDLEHVEKDHHPHQPPHALRDRHRCQRSAEDGPEGQPRNAGPLDHVHRRGRLAGWALAPCGQLRTAPCRACGYRAAVAQDRDARGPGMDAPLSCDRPDQIAFGARIEVFMQDGSRIVDELAVANAHPLGARPFGRDDYIGKFGH